MERYLTLACGEWIEITPKAGLHGTHNPEEADEFAADSASLPGSPKAPRNHGGLLLATDTVYNAHNAADELCWVGSRAGSCSTRPGGATTYSYDGNGPVFANRNPKLPIFGNRLSIRRQAG